MKKHLLPLILLWVVVQTSYATVHFTNAYLNIYTADRYVDLDLDGDDDFGLGNYAGDYGAGCPKSTSFMAVDGLQKIKAYSNGATGLGTYSWYNGLASLDYFLSTSKYMAVKFNNGSNTHYGWIHVEYYAGYLYIMGYAYEDVPNQPLNPSNKGVTAIHSLPTITYGVNLLGSQHIAFENCSDFDRVLIHTMDGRQVTEIRQPTANHSYFVGTNGVLLFTYFRNEELIGTTKQRVK